MASNQGQWVQKKIPLSVSPPSSKSDCSLNSMSTVCRVLFEEEQHAFREAMGDATSRSAFWRLFF